MIYVDIQPSINVNIIIYKGISVELDLVFVCNICNIACPSTFIIFIFYYYYYLRACAAVTSLYSLPTLCTRSQVIVMALSTDS
jgi:hypothetical protein